jgi:hypothetical protein
VLQNDNDLVAAVEANAVYTVQLSIAFQAGVAGAIKFDFTLPAGATFNTYRYLANTGGGPTLRHDTIATASTVAILPGSATNDALTIQGLLVVAPAAAIARLGRSTTRDAERPGLASLGRRLCLGDLPFG